MVIEQDLGAMESEQESIELNFFHLLLSWIEGQERRLETRAV